MGFTAFAVGAGVKAVGAYQSAKAQKSAAQANASFETQQAGQAITAGQMREESSRLQTAQTFGAQRAALAANGVDLGQGSANDVLTTTKVLGNRDAATIQQNALMQAWGYKTEAAMSESEAANIHPGEAAFSSLLGSATSTTGASAVQGFFAPTKKPGRGITVPDASTWTGGDTSTMASMG